MWAQEAQERRADLFFFRPKDEESVKLKDMVERGQRIIEENKDKPSWSSGIIELEVGLAERIANCERCEKAFEERLDELLKGKLFRKKELLIAEEDVIAKGDIFVVPKFKQKELEKDKRTVQERVKDYFKKN